ncbi:hypothetical protein [Streptomyces sp. NPDC046976]|uniref:hypothetical protein n=1 Tax=Streptomyces sp. NPDC046976 TaxID=3155258 RepID=UPI0033F6E3C3
MTAAPQTGIKNADDLINLAHAFGLTITVETTTRETLTSYVVRFAIPVPVAYAGTELGRAIAGDTLTLLWTRSKKKGARGCLVDATVGSAVASRKVRTLHEVNAAVDTLGHSSAKYARDAAPFPEDVTDAPHALYINGELRREGVPAAQVRRIVKNRRFNGRIVHQDEQGAIHCDTRRYVPQSAAVAEQPAATAEAEQLLGTGEEWEQTFNMFGKDPKTKIIDRADALKLIAWALEEDWAVYRPTTGGLSLENTTGESSYWLRPATPERQHVRTVNGGAPVLIPTRDALAEMNNAMMAPGKHAVREMSESRAHARIVYRDERGTVDLRPADAGATPAVQEQRPTVQELTGAIDDSHLASLADMYPAIADGTAIPVRADMIRPGMDVIAAVRLEDRTVDTVKVWNGPNPWVRVTWTTRTHADSVSGDARVFGPDHHLIVTAESLNRVYGTTPTVRPTAQELTGEIEDDELAHLTETYPAIADGTAIPVRADMICPGMDTVTSSYGPRTVSNTRLYDGRTPWIWFEWTTAIKPSDECGFSPSRHLPVTRDSIDRLYGAAEAPAPRPGAEALAPRPAAEILAADPIPADTSVWEGMPGTPSGPGLLPTPDALNAEEYAVQIRSGRMWVLPNHDDGAHMTQAGVISALARVRKNSADHIRASVDTDGTVYLSNGHQAARYIPARLIAGYRTDVCPGCNTPYATNGDGPCAGGSSAGQEAPADDAKTRRRAEGFAAKWWAEQHTEEPTDDRLRTTFANCVKPPRPELYPAIREAITDSTPPAAAAPLFAALAAREAADEAADLAPATLHRLVNHLETLPLAAPPALHERLRAARDTAEGAWESLRAAHSLSAKTAARSAAKDAIVRVRAAILSVQPHARRMHGTDMPHTADSIRAAALAYMHVGATPDETDAIKSGTAEVRVDCRPDTGTGWTVTARITAGIRDVGWFLPAHPPIIVKFRRVDGRLSPADNARKVIGSMLHVDVPVKYNNPARR